MSSVTAYTYGVDTFAECLQRAALEVERLESLEEQELPRERGLEVVSAANVATSSLWHLTDFVFKASDPEAAAIRARVGGTNRKDFQQRVRAACPAIKLCWEMVNGAKHLEQLKHAQVDKVSLSAGASVTIIATPSKPTSGKIRAKVIFPDGRRLRTSAVLRDALREWERFRP